MTDKPDPTDFDKLEYGEIPLSPRPAKKPRSAPAPDQGGDEWADYLLRGYVARHDWHREPATEKQIAALRKRGYTIPPSLTKGEAAAAMDRPTPRQRAVLIQWRCWRDSMSFAQAREKLDELLGGR